jgi:hypothetical protein
MRIGFWYDRCSRVGAGTGLVAKYGVNYFIVKAPKIIKEDFPEHYTNMTIYGRLISQEYMINVDVAFTFNSTVRFC